MVYQIGQEPCNCSTSCHSPLCHSPFCRIVSRHLFSMCLSSPCLLWNEGNKFLRLEKAYVDAHFKAYEALRYSNVLSATKIPVLISSFANWSWGITIYPHKLSGKYGFSLWMCSSIKTRSLISKANLWPADIPGKRTATIVKDFILLL